MKRFLLVLTAAVAAAPVFAADAPAAPAASIKLCDRRAEGTPSRVGFTHTGGGNIDVQQPSPDTVVVTMTGVAVAGGHPCKASLASLAFDLGQDFEVALDGATRATLTVEARVVGLLRSHAHGGGSAGISCPAHAAVAPCGAAGGPALVAVALDGRTVAAGENLSVNDRRGPVSAVVGAGRFTLRQRFGVQAAHPRKLLPCKTASAEFAPDPALDPLWISYWEPFRGAQKKDFGFQVTLKVAAEAEKKAEEKEKK